MLFYIYIFYYHNVTSNIIAPILYIEKAKKNTLLTLENWQISDQRDIIK
jgi:hypothetical protein